MDGKWRKGRQDKSGNGEKNGKGKESKVKYILGGDEAEE